VDTHNAFVPPVFVIQIQIPSDPPSGFFTSAEDGPGWAILMYYRISEVTIRAVLCGFNNGFYTESLRASCLCTYPCLSLIRISICLCATGRGEPAEGPEHRLARREALR
jgi:hypothetical protein